MVALTESDTKFIPNLPKGPLDEYRNQVKFDWKRLRLVFEDIHTAKIKVSKIACCILIKLVN